jgi:thiamine kinase-like enzyme
MTIIEEVVTRINDWKGRNVFIQPLSGGLTNTNFKVAVDGKPYFVRVPGKSTDLLAIDRNIPKPLLKLVLAQRCFTIFLNTA